MTAPIQKTIRSMTGHEALTCPWRAFRDPFVRDVLNAVPFFENGNLAAGVPEPSHRLMEGIVFFQQTYNRVMFKQNEARSKPDAAPIPEGLPSDRFGRRHGR